MDLQTAFNIAVGFGAFTGGWVLNTMWGAIKDMQTADKALIDRVAAVEVLVAGQYVPRSELDTQFTKIGNALERIEDKLSSKADK
jgi:hypothetical protein